MLIALHDADKTQYPNLALMKLSAWHKQNGDTVKWMDSEPNDFIYSSKVFTFTEEVLAASERSLCGGTGYKNSVELPDIIEHICPDYSLYGLDYSMGFLTRGCIRNCPHCFVPKKEGAIRGNADVLEFCRHKNVVLMDNNVLAHPHGLSQIEKMAKFGLHVDFNQGLDARFIDNATAKLLGNLKWLSPVRLACDSLLQVASVEIAVRNLRWNNVTPRRYFCYVLVKDVADALERVKILKGLNVDPFCQPYRDAEGTPPTAEQKHFARWVNHKAEYNSRTWEEYKESLNRSGEAV